MNDIIKRDGMLILLAVGGLLWLSTDAGRAALQSLTSGLASGAGNAVAGTVQGIADAANQGLNNAAKAASGGKDETLGAYVWRIFHPKDAEGLDNGIDLNGNPLPPGALY